MDTNSFNPVLTDWLNMSDIEPALFLLVAIAYVGIVVIPAFQSSLLYGLFTIFFGGLCLFLLIYWDTQSQRKMREEREDASREKS